MRVSSTMAGHQRQQGVCVCVVERATERPSERESFETLSRERVERDPRASDRAIAGATEACERGPLSLIVCVWWWWSVCVCVCGGGASERGLSLLVRDSVEFATT